MCKTRVEVTEVEQSNDIGLVNENKGKVNQGNNNKTATRIALRRVPLTEEDLDETRNELIERLIES